MGGRARAGWRGSLSLGVVAYGCGQQTVGTCSDDGTCASDGGGDALDDGQTGGGDTSTGKDGGGAEAATDNEGGADGSGRDDGAVDGSAQDGSTDSSADTWDGFDGFACHPGDWPSQSPCVIDESIGVFVASAVTSTGSDTSGDGSRAHPYATVGKALAEAHLKMLGRVYVCNATYTESVHISGSTEANLFGGLACPGSDAGAAWSYVGGVATFTQPAGSYALNIDTASDPLVVQDMAFTTGDANSVDSAGNGVSSIAVLVNSSIVTFTDVKMTAGKGANGSTGASGASTPNYTGSTAPNGSAGYSPTDGGNGSGASGTASCSSGASKGGPGG